MKKYTTRVVFMRKMYVSLFNMKFAIVILTRFDIFILTCRFLAVDDDFFMSCGFIIVRLTHL